MATKPNDIAVYTAANGKAPFSDWLNGLRDMPGRAIIRTRVNRLRLGNFGDCKPVGSGVFELRIDYGPGYRVYLGKEADKLVVLLSGGDKRSQKRDIAQAQKYWDDYRSRDND